MAGISGPEEEDPEGEAPGLLQSFGHMLGQTGVGPSNLHVYSPKPAGLMQTGAGASLPRGIAAPVQAAPAPVMAPPPKITAYHGTPHDFDQFDIGKIGTGEGAQVYGHGLYFAENPKVAKEYQDRLRPTSRPTLDPNSPVSALWYKYANDKGTIKAGNNINYTNPDDIVTAVNKGYIKPGQLPQELYDAVHSHIGEGHLYQVEINADPSHFLDWDKPLSEQSPEVQRALEPLGFKKQTEDEIYRQSIDAGWTDESARDFAKKEAAKQAANDPLGSRIIESSKLVPGEYSDKVKASEVLNNAGIKGIRYLDQGSRFGKSVWSVKHPQGGINEFPDEESARAFLGHSPESTLIPPPSTTRNYVLFDDKHVNITHKNGVKVTPVETDPFAEGKAFGGPVLQEVEYDPFSVAA